MKRPIRTPECLWCGQADIVWVKPDEYNNWQSGALIQNAFPDMRKEEREMLITGTHPTCWEKMWKDDQEQGED